MNRREWNDMVNDLLWHTPEGAEPFDDICLRVDALLATDAAQQEAE